ncbi:MAG: hypothetical protein ACYC9S_05385 [Leptospirales bacterium]
MPSTTEYEQEDLALRAGIPLSTYRIFEQRRRISPMNLVRVSLVLEEETSLLHLFGISAPASLLDLPTLAWHHRKRLKAGAKMKIPTRRLEIFLRFSDQEAFFVGVVAEERKKIYFQYTPEFIRRGIDLSPFFPLKETVQDDQNRVFVGLPGLFFDSSGLRGALPHGPLPGSESHSARDTEFTGSLGLYRGQGNGCSRLPAHFSERKA